MTFVYLSANYPDNHWLFCAGLAKRKVKVLAIVDQPVDSLTELVAVCEQVRQISSFNQLDELCALLTDWQNQYGQIDGLESNNEAWLEIDAYLRERFHIPGYLPEQLRPLLRKSVMKQYYQQAHIPVCDYRLPKSMDEIDFPYPFILKPNRGMGANHTYQITHFEQLTKVWSDQIEWICEPYINQPIFTLDALVDQNSHILYCSKMVYLNTILDVIEQDKPLLALISPQVNADELDLIGRCAQAFSIQNRYIHAEFFENEMGLEVNLRPPGGLVPDAINFAADLNVYDLWAEMILNQAQPIQSQSKHQSLIIGRSHLTQYTYSSQQIAQLFPVKKIVHYSSAYAQAMGEECMIVQIDSPQALQSCIEMALRR